MGGVETFKYYKVPSPICANTGAKSQIGMAITIWHPVSHGCQMGAKLFSTGCQIPDLYGNYDLAPGPTWVPNGCQIVFDRVPSPRFVQQLRFGTRSRQGTKCIPTGCQIPDLYGSYYLAPGPNRFPHGCHMDSNRSVITSQSKGSVR